MRRLQLEGGRGASHKAIRSPDRARYAPLGGAYLGRTALLEFKDSLTVPKIEKSHLPF
jgi:hypothetical protein